MEQIVIRPMEQADLPRCCQIEQYAPDPWTAQQMAEELEFSSARMFVALWQGELAGVAAFQLAADEATLNTITVHPNFRQKGIAAELLKKGLCELKEQGAECCFLEVRSQNTPARKLYEKLEFVEAGLRRGFYKNPSDDAVVMTKKL